MTLWSSTLGKQLLSFTNFIICSRRFLKPLIRIPVATLSKVESEEWHKKKNHKYMVCKSEKLEKLNFPNYEHLGFTPLNVGDDRFGLYISKASKSRNESIKNPKIILEGTRLIADAINADANVKCIYFTKKEVLTVLPLDKLSSETSLYQVTESEMKTWSETTHSAGLLAVACKPKDNSNYKPLLPITMVLDGIKDEGHLGTLIRSAAAAGMQRVFVTSSSADPWTPKVIRSAMGGHFFIPVIMIDQHTLEGHIYNTNALYIIDEPRENSSVNLEVSQKKHKIAKQINTVNYDEIVFKKDSMLMIGGKESNKIIKNIPSKVAYITTPNNFDAFGPAINGSVILYEMKRQLDNDCS